MSLLVYVAGPYSAPTPEAIEANVATAIDAGNILIDAGLDVRIPHLSHFQHARKARHYEAWMALDFRELARCDALFRVHGDSPGADREVAFAETQGLPVFHSIAEVVRWASR
jgi:nucleoside 2-deoxyribosyltransferase